MRLFTANLPDQAAQAVILQKSVLVTAGIAWFLAMYVGPIASLLRSPFPERINITLGVAYLAVLFVLAWINAQAGLVESASLGKPAGLSGAVLKELVQPLFW